MNWADWTIIGIVGVSCLIGLKRGFVKEALSLACWVVAFFVAVTFRAPLSALLVDAISTPSVREITAFALLFTATLIVGALISYLIGELVRITGLSGTDRLFGMVFGAARGAIVVMAILLLVPAVVPIDQDPWWRQSNLIPSFLTMEDWARRASDQFVGFAVSFF